MQKTDSEFKNLSDVSRFTGYSVIPTLVHMLQIKIPRQLMCVRMYIICTHNLKPKILVTDQSIISRFSTAEKTLIKENYNDCGDQNEAHTF